MAELDSHPLFGNTPRPQKKRMHPATWLNEQIRLDAIAAASVARIQENVAKHPDRFSASEILLLPSVLSSVSFSHRTAFETRTDAHGRTLIFTDREALDKYPKAVDFCIGHEIRHEITRAAEKQGISPMWPYKYNALKLAINFGAPAAVLLNQDENPAHQKKNWNTWQKIGAIPFSMIKRYEENLCDDFALRGAPETDLDQLSDYFSRHNENTTDMLGRLISSHPTDAARLAHLRKKQPRLR